MSSLQCLFKFTFCEVTRVWNSHWKLWSLIWKWKYSIWNKFVLASDYSLSPLVELNITRTKPSCLFVRLVTKKNMHKTKQKLAYRLVFCLVLFMFFFRDSSDEQAFGFSASYYRRHRPGLQQKLGGNMFLSAPGICICSSFSRNMTQHKLSPTR